MKRLLKQIIWAMKRKISKARSKRFNKSISKSIENLEKICFELSQHAAAFGAGDDAVDAGK